MSDAVFGADTLQRYLDHLRHGNSLFFTIETGVGTSELSISLQTDHQLQPIRHSDCIYVQLYNCCYTNYIEGCWITGYNIIISTQSMLKRADKPCCRSSNLSYCLETDRTRPRF